MMIVCGVDVSGAALDARVGKDGPYRRFERDPHGIAALAAFCREHGVELVAMEASGGYEKLPFALLWQEAVPCAVVNPRAVRRFAEGMSFLEKTDRIDAGVIAHYAAVKGIGPQQPAAPAQERLRALTTRLRQLTAFRVAQDNQRRDVADPAVLASFEDIGAALRRQARILEQEIAELLAADPLWARLAETFRAIKGVADRTVATVLALLPEIGTCSNKAIAKLAGLAPIANDSGKRSGQRHIRGGRAPVRGLLVLVAGIVAKYEPDFQAARDRLAAAGKPKLVIRVALARKLLVRLNAKARDARKFAIAA
jgi:transposase